MLSDNIPYPAWTTPTPACYDLTTENHYDIKMGNCNGDDKCSGDEDKYNGCTHTSYTYYFRTTGGVEILYPPFADRTIKFIKQRDNWAWCDWVRSVTKNWYASDLHIQTPNVDYGDDFGGLDHLRYSSYQFDEKGASRTGISASCPFKTYDGWPNVLLCEAAQLVKFNRMPIIATDLETSSHVQTNAIKQVYCADADKNVDYTLSSRVGNGRVRTYCFAPLAASPTYGTFSTDDSNMEGEYNAVSGTYYAYTKQWGSTAGSHSYRFRMEDWKSVSTLSGRVSVGVEPYFTGMDVKKLNGGIEVYIVVLAEEEVEYPALNSERVGGKVQFYGKPRLLRTHVYPVKPSWNRARFRSNFCINDAPIDLRDYVTMGSVTFAGKFTVVEGSADILDSTTLDVSKMAVDGNLQSRQLIKIRCYPYWTAQGEADGTSPYMEFSAYVYPKPTLTVVNELEKVCSYDTEFTPDSYDADLAGTGVYTGSFLRSGKLNASDASEDGYTNVPLTYTYTATDGGCQVSESYEQPISAAPDLSDFRLPKTTFCFAEEVKLRECTSVTGGTFSGFGVAAGDDGEPTFSSAFAGIGSGDIYFRKTANGCNAEKVVTVSVRDLQESTVTFSQPPAMCANGDPIYLPDYLSDSWASNGTFSGKGVESPRFYPDKAGAEFPKVTYSYGLTGCKQTLTQEVRVKTPATLTLSSIPAICSASDVDLSGHLNLKGGTFTGTGISGSTFAPVEAGIGSHPITYAVTDANGCPLSRDFNVVVNDLLADDVSFEGMPEQCSSDEGYIDLRFYVKGHSGGTFSGRGVENYRFYPAQASAGFNMLTYTYGAGGCRRTLQAEVYVTATPAVTFEKFDRVCDNDPVKLMDYVTPKGGTFSGAGVVDNVFYPTEAGLGTHEIQYATAVGTCTISSKTYINVVGLSDNDAAFRSLPELCLTDDGYIDLRGYIVNAPDNGTFTGTGVEGFRYYPGKAKAGFNTLTYSFMSGACPKTLRAEVFVRSVPAVSFRAIRTICTGTTVDLSSYVGARGGAFTGAGVVGSTFYAEQAGVGRHEVTYTVTSSGCPSTARVTIDVADLQDEEIGFSAIPPVCKSDSSWVDLRTYINHEGGTFSGQGVENFRFYPTRASEGYVMIGYNYGEGSCRKTANVEIFVRGKPTVAISALPVLCEADAEVNLQSYANPRGGVFSGVGVSSNIFSAAAAQIGRHTVTYAYTDNNGCTNSVSSAVEVGSAYSAAVTFGGLPTLCSTDKGYYELHHYVQGHTGGTFGGQGVENGCFYPARARAGVNTLTYTYGSGSCQKVLKADVNVTAVPATRPIAVAKVCSSEPIMLMNHVNNKGGEFTGNGVQGSVFYPTAAGFGVHDIAYEVLIGNCYSMADLSIDVLSVAAPPVFDQLPTLCKSDSGYIDLREHVLSYQEGTFSGQGVESYRYYPMRARDGFNTVTYTYGSGSCQRSLKTEIYVTPRPELTLTPFARVCHADTIPLALYASIPGGAWSGRGVFDGSFIAEQAGTGTHQLTYTVTQGLCRVSEAVSVEVAALLPKLVIFDSIPQRCAQDLGYIDLKFPIS
jgi:hypothetical protein